MTSEQPLAGLRVLDLSTAWAGPLAGRLLSDFGAEVIKIECCQRPDIIRYERMAEGKADGKPWERSWWCILNRGRFGITLNLTKEPAKEIFLKLVALSDVVIENYSPRVMKNFGLHYEVLQRVNPRVIMISMSAYGQTGPYRDYIGYGATIEPVAGLSHLAGYHDGPPLQLDSSIGDPSCAFFGAGALLAALHHRNSTGRGQHVDLSEAESVMQLIGSEIMDFTLNGRSPMRKGNRHRRMAPHNCYRCRGEDEWVAIAVESDEQWLALCRVMDRWDLATDERYAEETHRWQNQDILDKEIEAWAIQRDRSMAMESLQAAGIAAGPLLQNRELFEDPHLRARGYWQIVEQPELGRRPFPTTSLKLSRTPGSIQRRAPTLGEHNHYILRGLLGLPDEVILQLREEEIIGEVPVPNPVPEIVPVSAWQERGAVAHFDLNYRQRLGLV